MLSRQILLKRTLKPALSLIKIDNAAHIHLGCTRYMNFISVTSRNLKNHCRRDVLSRCLQVRYDSSSSPVSQQDLGLNTTTGLEVIPEPPPVPSTDIAQSVIKDLANEPAFSSMDLGGWTPVGMVQSGLEFLHIDWGLPWWGAVVCGTLIIRFLMFPIVVISQRNAAKLNNNLPQMQHLQMKTTEARQRGDKLDAARYTAEMMTFMKEKDVNPIKNMLPPLCQAPIFVSVFMGLRGMCNIPVESLKTGGTWWFVDLTVPDQFYLLPIITSATLYCTMKLGVDGGQPTQNMMLAKYLMMGIPVIMIPFTIKFPGLVLVYWTTSNFISLAQVGFLRIPKIRSYFKIPQLVKHEKTNLPMQDKGFVKNMKESWNNLKITSELDQRERADRMAFMQAGREPIKKTYKYNPTKIPPIEAKKRT